MANVTVTISGFSVVDVKGSFAPKKVLVIHLNESFSNYNVGDAFNNSERWPGGFLVNVLIGSGINPLYSSSANDNITDNAKLIPSRSDAVTLAYQNNVISTAQISATSCAWLTLVHFADNVYLPYLTTFTINTITNYNGSYTAPTTSAWGTAELAIREGGYGATTFTIVASQNVLDCGADIAGHIIHEGGDPYADIDGESDLTGETVAFPGDPGLSVTSTGIVGLFSPTSAQMQALADFMWTDFGGTGTTVEDILSEIVQALKRSISNPLDYVIGLNIIPSQGLSKGGSKVIRFGFVSSGVSMPELTSQFFTVDCGEISFDYLCGNTFLDYAPYSKFSIYLPYIGVKEVDANDFVGHTIGVKYKGDVVTGGLTAFITKDGSIMYQYSGSCALNIPLTADNWGSTISAAINVATAVVGAASIPGAGLAASAAKAGKAAVGATVSNVAANPSLLSPQVARSGAISGGAGAIGIQRPYVIREAVRFHSTENFNTLTGYPAYYFRSLADVTGYTVVYDCHLENIPATDGEIREIEQLLTGGVIL